MFRKVKKKSSIWLMIEIFFSITLLTVMFLYLVSTIYSFRATNTFNTNLFYENVLNNLYILEKQGFLYKLVDNFEYKILENYLRALYPFGDINLYVYDSAYVMFFVLDTNSNLNEQRLVKFHFFFPMNVNKKTIQVYDVTLQNLPTKVEFNYYFSKILYSVSSLSNYNCTYLEASLNNLPYNIGDIKKIRLFLDNYEIKNFSWQINNGLLLIKINEKIETGSNSNKHLYIFLTNTSNELGKNESSQLINVNNCLPLTTSIAQLNFQLSNLGTVFFNYDVVRLPDNGKEYFYLNFISNNDNINYSINNNINNSNIFYNDSFVSIRNDFNIVYGTTKSDYQGNNLKEFVLPFYYKQVYHELHFILGR